MNKKYESISEKIDKVIEKELFDNMEKFGHWTNEQKNEYRIKKKKELLKEAIELQKAELEISKIESENEEISLNNDLLRKQRELNDMDTQFKQSELDEYNSLTVDFSRREAKASVYHENYRLDPQFEMKRFEEHAVRANRDIKEMSEERRKDKNKVLDKMIDRQQLEQIGNYIASDEERKIFESYLKNNNGQVDLLEFAEQMPKTMQLYLEAGNYSLNAILDGINKKAESISHISENMFQKGNIFKEAMVDAEDNRRRIIDTKAIEQATQGVSKQKIDTELSIIRAERIQEKNNSIKERE